MKNIPYLCRCMRQGIYFDEHYVIGNSFDRNLCDVEVTWLMVSVFCRSDGTKASQVSIVLLPLHLILTSLAIIVTQEFR